MKNIKEIILYVFLAMPAVLFPACATKDAEVRNVETPDAGTVQKVFAEGLPKESLLPEMNVKVSEEMARELEKATGEDGYVAIPEVKSLSGTGAVRMRRLFPYAGEFEPRTRAEGLHRWYVLSYGESSNMTRAAAGLEIPGVEIVEYCPRIGIVGDPKVVSYSKPSTRASVSYPFDDPMLGDQWHYYNNGTVSSSVSGCDINVFPVWKNYSTYSKYSGDIIVGVVDEGIDYTHEDLKDNMWHNPENSGNNVYGKNFTDGSFIIRPESHGTHVAGTIAAVNNNGTGVCGVAGGDSKKGIKGAKLMSCQIFDGENQGSGAEAIKWSADHGAVISQNSWGYTDLTSTPSSLKDAVDYFVKYAGLDASGNQTGPMIGGLVIFAAGNENRSYSGNDYDKILNVTSVGADFKRAYYTCYGDWADIAAPGGDAKKGNQVLSTLPGNKYGEMQGTSMACPHVSGVAALVLARFGGMGYTSAALRKQIEDNVTDISALNANYYLGKGLVNAYKAIAGSGGKAPDTPKGLSASTQSNNLKFSVTIPSDADDGKPTSVYIYYSTSDFSSTDKALFGSFYVEDLSAGDVLSGTISGLEFNKVYHIAAAACDLAGNKSGLTSRISVTTGSNNAPVITPVTGLSFTLKPYQSAVAGFEITEPDGHFYNIDLVPGSAGATLDTITRDKPKIRIAGASVPTGTYTAKLTVTDLYGASADKEVAYTVLENHKPVKVEAFEDKIFNSRTSGTVELPVSDYFNDEDGEDLTYTFSFSDPSVANMTYSKGKFLLTPINYGITEIKVTGTDVRGEAVSQTFKVLVRESSKEVELYPNPVKTNLYVRTGKTEEISVKVISASGAIFLDKSLVSVSPFAPLEISMKDASAGQYTVVIEADGQEFKSYIVKI